MTVMSMLSVFFILLLVFFLFSYIYSQFGLQNYENYIENDSDCNKTITNPKLSDDFSCIFLCRKEKNEYLCFQIQRH